MWCWCGVSCAPLVVVSTGPEVCRRSRIQDLLEVGSGPLVVRSMPFVPFLLCLWCIALEYGSISRFKGVFSAFWGADVCLYGFGVLRGLCGFCARVELGGLEACGVFASILSSFLSSFLSFCTCFHCLSYCPLLVLSLCLPSLCGLLLFPFPLRMYEQKERALRVGASSLVLLWVCYILINSSK